MAYKAVLIDDNKNTVLSLEYSLEWENLGIELAELLMMEEAVKS